MKVLLTGASGFVGRAIVSRLSASPDTKLAVAVRSKLCDMPEGVILNKISALDGTTDWHAVVEGIDAVIHSAAHVHVMNDWSADSLTEFRKVNVEGTLNLARQAAAAGVRRFVHLSSIKVNGEGTELDKPYTADDQPTPSDPYGISKLEAEQGLLRLASETGIEVVIIRPVLVYGVGVKANFLSMIKWLGTGIPLPLGAIHNARSMVALDNLVDLLVTCLSHPAAAGQIFLVSDGEDVSTTDLLRRTARAMGKKAFLLPVPASWLEFGACLLGRRSVAQRLCGSLQVDIGKTCRLLGWKPLLTLDQGLEKVVKDLNR